MKARAFFLGGSEASETVAMAFGCERSSWRVVKVSYDSPFDNKGCAGADKLLDDDPTTYWHTYDIDTSKSAAPQEAVLDMGRTRNVEAFTFLPRQAEAPDGKIDDSGTPDQFEFYLSNDGEHWNLAARGGVKEPQGMQIIPLEKPQSGRYLRFVATHVKDDSFFVAVAGIGIIEKK